ncbi:helix-turn-helix transcriptional regulator [Geothrix campi]|uniref:helix-turn-helix transcriptional regulator n=1 Tax=Geothrix campi TaxID=2966450 RepID=UPI002148F674|nr:helix-turn-helix transcriptional regulator [Geothrix sp. SG10]
MKGREVKAIRATLGWTAGNLADLLAVHATTVFRWEAQGDRPIKAEGMAKRVLGWLAQVVALKPAIEQLQKRMDREGHLAAFAYVVGYGYGLELFRTERQPGGFVRNTNPCAPPWERQKCPK